MTMNSATRSHPAPTPPLTGEVDDRRSAGGGNPANPLPDPLPQAGEEAEKPARQKQIKREKRDINGWLVLDKPVGMTSTHAVAVIKRIYKAKRAGHAGTLDPLASGLLPIALGEATKTVPFVMDGEKIYLFTVRWGEERDTDDAEGRAVETSAARPSADAIRALLPRFTGTIAQVPPRYSAVKIAGERAYDLARDGETVELEARPVDIHSLELVEMPDADTAAFAAQCGKGTYVRALARDMGRALGCFGYVTALRRTSVGPFDEQHAIGLDALTRGEQEGDPNSALLPVAAGLASLPSLSVSRADAGRLARGQPVLLRGRDAPIMEGFVAVSAQGSLLALAEIDKGELHPRRVFNLSQSV
jgi:tRNA pseudouridine55 synthase